MATVLQRMEWKIDLIVNQIRLEFGDEEGTGPVEGEGDGGGEGLALGRHQLHVHRPCQWTDS